MIDSKAGSQYSPWGWLGHLQDYRQAVGDLLDPNFVQGKTKRGKREPKPTTLSVRQHRRNPRIKSIINVPSRRGLLLGFKTSGKGSAHGNAAEPPAGAGRVPWMLRLQDHW